MRQHCTVILNRSIHILRLQPPFFHTCIVTVIKAIDSVCVHFPMADMGLFFDQEIIVEIEIV